MSRTMMSAGGLGDWVSASSWPMSMGPWSALEDLSMPLGTARVLAGSLGGTPVVVKHHLREKNYVREREALQLWAPQLDAGAAPGLLAHDDVSCTLLMSRLDGNDSDGTDLQDHVGAGRLLGQLHAIRLGDSSDLEDGTAEMRERFEQIARTAFQIIEPRIIDFASSCFEQALPLIATLPQGAIHNDFQPRNWLSLRNPPYTAVIDFGKSRRGLLVTDFERLYFQEWSGRRDGLQRRNAFESGYGRRVSDLELEVLRLLGPMQAMGTITYARRSGSVEFEAIGWSLLDRYEELR